MVSSRLGMRPKVQFGARKTKQVGSLLLDVYLKGHWNCALPPGR